MRGIYTYTNASVGDRPTNAGANENEATRTVQGSISKEKLLLRQKYITKTLHWPDIEMRATLMRGNSGCLA